MKLCESCGAVFDDNYDLCGFDGGSLTDLFPGARVIGGRYLLEQRVAAGAMGIVVRATHLQVGSTVAVKLMRPKKDDTHVALARFQREAQILGQIKHPNAVLVIDFGVEQRGGESHPYIVMEFLRGESLLSVLESKERLTLEELERILVPLCDAVEEAHAVGVIHRDIKPSNVVLEKLRDGSEIVKVLDFGIAKFVARGKRPKTTASPSGPAGTPSDFGDMSHSEIAELLADDEPEETDWLDEVASTREEAAHATVSERPRSPRAVTVEGAPLKDPTTEAGFMIGTIPYMAPEQMTGERISVRTDVHAVAVLAFQCLAGRLPYDGDDEDIIAAKLTDERPSLADVGVDVPPEVDAILQRAFALSPAERPASVREIGDAVRAAVSAARSGSERDPMAKVSSGLHDISSGLGIVEAAAAEWVDSITGEEHYVKARDVLLGVDAPLRRVRALVDAPGAPMPLDTRKALKAAHRAFEAHVAGVRRGLARIDPDVAADYGDYLAALWTRLDGVAQEIIDRLHQLLDDEKGSDTGPLMPSQLFAENEQPRASTLADLAERLHARDPIDAVDALDELLTSSVDQVVRATGPDGDRALAEKLVHGLWRHADSLLLYELSPSRRTFRLLPYLAGLRELPAAAPFALLARMFGSALEGDDVSLALASLEKPEDRTALARCLLVHPSERARELAVQALELSDLWSVIAHPTTPIAVESFLFEQVRPRAPNEYLKIFFFCVRDNLRAAVQPNDVTAALKLLARFFQVTCFHEDIVFEPLLDLDRTLRQRAANTGAALPDALAGDTSYAENLAAFTAGGARETKPLGQMRDVPLPIQRKLAREGHFLLHFVSHSNDRVARETLPHIYRMDDVTPYLRIPTIHRMVLTEIAKRKRFFRKEPPRIALLQNPKTPAIIARLFLPLVSQDQLRILSTNKHINPDVRRLITTTLARAPY